MQDDATIAARRRAFPERLGPCRLLEGVGSGGMGTVFRAEMVEPRAWAPAGALVAVKVLRDASEGGEGAARFLREARLGTSIAHPCVARTFAADRELVRGVEHAYLVMELVEGRTLRALLSEHGRLPEPLVRHVGARTARALEAVHAAGAVHRDVKPSNVILTPEREVKLVDFGIARRRVAADDVTEEGCFAGTAAYASPEQLRGEPALASSDLHALGMVLFELLAGRLPFASADPIQVLEARRSGPCPRLADVAPDVSPLLDDLVAAMVDTEPGARPASAAACAEALELGEGSAWWREREAGWRARTARRVLPRLRAGATALVGRQAELDALRDALSGAVDGRGGLVLVEGEAGIGKSRLVAALVGSIEDEAGAVTVLHGSATASPSGDPVGEALRGHFGDAGLEAAIARRLDGPSPHVSDLAALLCGRATSGRLDAEAAPALVAQVARALSRERPAAWILEDVHECGRLGRELITALARVAAAERMLVVASTRPGLDAAHRARLLQMPGARALRLERLDPQAVRGLLHVVLGSETLARRLAPSILERTDGNPLFVIAMAQQAGVTATSGSSSHARRTTTRAEDLVLPATLTEMLLGRIAGVDDDDRALLDLAAVQGRDFDADVLATATGRPRLEVLQRLAALERRHGVVRSRGAAHAFDHHLLQELLHARLPPALRAESHARVADALARRCGRAGVTSGEDAVRLARHRLEAGDAPEAAPLVLDALDHLASRSDTDRMAALAQALVELAGEEPYLPAGRAPAQDEKRRAARWHLHRGDVAYAIGDLAAAHRHVGRALELLGHPVPDGTRMRRLVVREAIRQAAHLLAPAAAVRAARPQRREDLARASRAAWLLALIAQYRHDVAGSLGAGLLAVNLADRAGSASSGALGLLGLAASTLGLERLARAYFVRGMAVRDDADARQAGYCALYEVMALCGRGPLDALIARSDEALALAARSGSPLHAHLALGARSAGLLAFGRVQDALDGFLRQLDLREGEPATVHDAFAWMGAAHCGQLLGRFEDSGRWLDLAAGALPATTGLAGSIHAGLVAVQHLAAGRLDEARSAAADARARLSGWSGAVGPTTSTPLDVPVVVALAAWQRDVTSRDLARETGGLLRDLESWSRRHPVRHARTLLLTSRAARLAGDRDRALRTAERSLATALRHDLPLDQGLAHLELAQSPAIHASLRADHARRAATLLDAAGTPSFARTARSLDPSHLPAPRDLSPIIPYGP